jgi:hypothetical protein
LAWIDDQWSVHPDSMVLRSKMDVAEMGIYYIY